MRCPATPRTSWAATLGQRALARHDASVALPADDRAGHALRDAWCARREFEPLDADAAAALYELTDAMTSAAGPPRLRDQQPCAARAREPAQSHLLALRRLCRDRSRRARPPARNADGAAPEARELPLGARAQRPWHRRGGTAARRSRPRDEALVMGLRLAEGIDVDAIAAAVRRAAIVDWRRVDRLVASGHLSARRRAHRADRRRPAAARLTSSAKSPRASLGFWRLRASRPELARSAGVICGFGAGRAGAAFGAFWSGHELIIVGRSRDIIVDGHLGVVGGRLLCSSRSSSGTRPAPASGVPIWTVQACSDRPQSPSALTFVARRLGRRFMKAAAESASVGAAIVA